MCNICQGTQHISKLNRIFRQMLSYFPFWTFWSHFSLVCYPCRDPSGKLTTDRRNSMCLLLLSWFYFKTTSQHISFILCTLDTLFTIINFYKMHHYHFYSVGLDPVDPRSRIALQSPGSVLCDNFNISLPLSSTQRRNWVLSILLWTE